MLARTLKSVLVIQDGAFSRSREATVAERLECGRGCTPVNAAGRAPTEYFPADPVLLDEELPDSCARGLARVIRNLQPALVVPVAPALDLDARPDDLDGRDPPGMAGAVLGGRVDRAVQHPAKLSKRVAGPEVREVEWPCGAGAPRMKTRSGATLLRGRKKSPAQPEIGRRCLRRSRRKALRADASVSHRIPEPKVRPSLPRRTLWQSARW